MKGETVINVFKANGDNLYHNLADAEASLTESGWQPRVRQPGQWVKLCANGNLFASVIDHDTLEAAYTAGLIPTWTAAQLSSNRAVTYTVIVDGEAHRFPGWHAAELVANEFDSTVTITTAAHALKGQA